jgi:hypothetical protein
MAVILVSQGLEHFYILEISLLKKLQILAKEGRIVWDFDAICRKDRLDVSVEEKKKTEKAAVIDLLLQVLAVFSLKLIFWEKSVCPDIDPCELLGF